MFLQIPDVLTAEELATVDTAIEGGEFVDGAATAGQAAGVVKQNRQLKRTGNEEDLDKTILQALARHDIIRSACLPSRIVRPMINRYEAGMSYGWHTDNPLMAEGRPVRTDIAVTVFLTDPGDYEGGALVVNAAGGQAQFRLPRGHAVLYPASTIHCVQPVDKGVRHAAVTWIQSMVSDSSRRELLHDLDRASRIVREKDPTSDEARLLMKTHSNLVRMWVDT